MGASAVVAALVRVVMEMATAMVRAGVWHDLTKTISHGHNTTYVQRKS